MYAPYPDLVGMLLHINGQFTMVFISIVSFLVVHAHSIFSIIVALSIRTYSPILVVHIHSLFPGILAHSIKTISVISRRSVLLVKETAIHWQASSLNVVPLASSGNQTHNISVNRQTILRNTNSKSSKSDAIEIVVLSIYYMYIILGVWMCK